MKYLIHNVRIITAASLALATYLSSNPAYGFNITPKENEYKKDLLKYSKSDAGKLIFGETPILPKMKITKAGNLIKERYGCPECQFRTQYQANSIKWPDLVYNWQINLMPSEENFDFIVKGVESKVSYDNSYVKKHEEFHVSSTKNLFDKIFGKVVIWAKNYTAGWFNNKQVADASVRNDFKFNLEQALNEYDKSSKEIYDKYHEAEVVAGMNSGKKGSVFSEYKLNDQKIYDAIVKDVDESWRKETTDAIEKYIPQFQPQTSPGEAPVECPGPLPLLGLGVAFRYSRKLRNKLRSCN